MWNQANDLSKNLSDVGEMYGDIKVKCEVTSKRYELLQVKCEVKFSEMSYFK